MTRPLPNSQPFENNEHSKEFMLSSSFSFNSWSFPHVFLDFLDRLYVQSIVTWINTNADYLIYNTPFAKCCLWVIHIIVFGVRPKWTSTTHGLHAFTLKRQGVPFDLPTLNPKVTTKTHHKHKSHCLDEKLDVIGKNHKCQSHERSQTSHVFKSSKIIKMSYQMWTLHEV